MCTHPIDPMGIHLLCYTHGNECIATHDVICDTFVAIARDVGFHVGQEQLHALLSTTFNSSHQQVDIVFNKDGIRTLVDIFIANPTQAYLLPRSCTTQRFVCLRCSSSQGKELLQLTPHWSILPFNNWSIWLLTQTCWWIFTRLCQCHLELERARRPSSFYLGHFFSLESFNHITKDANILHLKSSGRHRLNYFLTSTPSRHTSHHHSQPIVSRWFLTWKNMVNLL